MPSTKEWEEFPIHEGAIIKDGKIQIQDKPGFWVELNEDYVRAHLAPGENCWG
jgi:L-alanine-DL-glutamate epimerase-like enolase superfamily enzyme